MPKKKRMNPGTANSSRNNTSPAMNQNSSWTRHCIAPLPPIVIVRQTWFYGLLTTLCISMSSAYSHIRGLSRCSFKRNFPKESPAYGESPTSGPGLIPTLSVNLARLFEHGLFLQVQFVLLNFSYSGPNRSSYYDLHYITA